MKKFAILLLAVVPMALIAGDQVPFTVNESSIHFEQPIFPTPENVAGGFTGRCAGLSTAGLPPGMGWGMFPRIISIGTSNLMGPEVDVESLCIALPVDPANASPPPPGTPIPFVAGDCLIIGAPGDTIHSTFSGTATVNNDGSMSIAGDMITFEGTGRFKGATGTSKVAGLQIGNSSSLTITGTLKIQGPKAD